MTLTHPASKYHIVADESFINTIIIENASVFSKAVHELMLQINGADGRFVLSENNKLLQISKKIDLIINPFDIDVNSKKILSKIYDNLEAIAVHEDLYIKTREMEQTLVSYLNDLNIAFTEPIDYDIDLKLSNLFKAVNVSIERSNSLVENIERYMHLNCSLLSVNWFFFINLKSYLSADELKQLFDSALYNKYYITLIESHEADGKYDFEKKYILDKDFCEIW